MARQDEKHAERRHGGAPWSIDRARLRHRVRLWMPATRQTVAEAVRRVTRIADRVGCSEERRCDLEIAVHEAVANALQHGNGNGNGAGHESWRGKIFVRCYADADGRLVVAVRDQGNGFDPDGVPDPRSGDGLHRDHGRGVLLMRELADHLAYRKGGREVVLYLDCDD